MPARYRIEFTPRARRDFRSFARDIQERIDVRILALTENPRPAGSKKLEGQEGLYRIRAGDYRIVYSLHEDVLLVLVVRIGHRREVYR